MTMPTTHDFAARCILAGESRFHHVVAETVSHEDRYEFV